MADTSSTSGITSSTAASTTANPPESKSWADQADEIDQAEQSADQAEQSSASNEEGATAEINIGSLQVDESKRENSTLSEPEDSSIQAVCFSSLFIVFVFFGFVSLFGA